MKQSRLQRIRLSRQEKRAAELLGSIPVLLVVIFVKFLWKTKRWLSLLGLILFIGWGMNYLAPHALSPMAKAELDSPAAGPSAQLSEHDQIKAYIREVFGKDADNAFKILACENHSLNPLATGHNTDGSFDRGIFQINSVHDVNPQYLYDWHINIDIAYHIFKEQGWSPWACETVYHALERNDTL